jgi:SAM-dependent methyltransferase
MSWLLAGGAAQWPAWGWLALLLPLLLLYPMRAWGDAPFFPTPPEALTGLRSRLDLPAAPRMLDAGCGAGHGLAALRHAWPDARCEGTEWSWPLALAARAHLRGAARVRRGDLWADDWSGFDLVYLFQRPESMPRAWAKARAEMRPGSWLVSLEFMVPGVPPDVTHDAGAGRAVHAWRIAAPDGAQSRADGADNPRRPAARRKPRP